MLKPEDRLAHFRDTAPLPTRKLASLLAATAVSLPVICLIRNNMVREANPSHVRELFLGGILYPTEAGFEFADGVRDLLLDSTPLTETKEALRLFLVHSAKGMGLYDYLDKISELEDPVVCLIVAKVIKRFGGEYYEIGKRMEKRIFMNPLDTPIQHTLY